VSIKPEQIPNLPNDVQASIVHVNPYDKLHLIWLSQAYKNLLGYEASIHGAGLTGHVPEQVMKAIKTNILKVQFIMVGKEVAGIATSAPTFTAKRNKKTNKIEIFEGDYLEDICVDQNMNKLFRRLTTLIPAHPKGIGLGTVFSYARIWQSVKDVFGSAQSGEAPAKIVKEVAHDNLAMAGSMSKLGGVIRTAKDSRVLELANGLTPDMDKRWGVNNVRKEDLPRKRRRKASCLNNFKVTWSSDDDKQEIVAIFTRTVSTFTGNPVVRLQLASNGNLPDSIMLKEVLATMMKAGNAEINERGWGLPVGTSVSEFGGPIPVIRIHAEDDPEIVQALSEMGAEDRKCGDKLMVATAIHTDKIPNQEKIFGQELPKASPVNVIDQSEDKYKPCFNIVSEASETFAEDIVASKADTSIPTLAPTRRIRGKAVKDNARNAVKNPTRPVKKDQAKTDVPPLGVAA